MNNNQFELYNDIPQDKFAFAKSAGDRHDQKLDTKPVGYFRDAFSRFAKNKASVVAAIVILILILYAIVGPFFIEDSYVDAYATDKYIAMYQNLLPRLNIFEGTGFWDGSEVKEVSSATYWKYKGIAQETGLNPIQKVISMEVVGDEIVGQSIMYKLRVDTYYTLKTFEVTFASLEEFRELQRWQDENGIQVILPTVDRTKSKITSDMSVWYECDRQGVPVFDENGELIPAYVQTGTDKYDSTMRIAGDPGIKALERVAGITDAEERQAALNSDPDWLHRYRYAYRGSSGAGDGALNYVVRVNAYNYFRYQYGFKPGFAFGTNSKGYDIFTRLASGARFSFILAICVSIINLTIGAIYGAIEGYYGGAADMIMERVSDILSGVPSTVVTILFQLHLADKVGVVGALVYSFVLTGWIGMASSVRMQFYRYKNQEYVLAARTLGANDWRIIWKHIFPNSLGTLITGSVFVIPGVMLSETSLSYLGILNLDSPTRASIGAMLSAGKDNMSTYPHVVFFPALFIGLLMICFNLFGNGLRDAFNPALRGTEE